jgi:hypothetical protein
VTYTFLIQQESGRDLSIMDPDPEPLDILRTLVDDDLHEVTGEAGYWATLDCKTTVQRYEWVPLGQHDDDHMGVGVKVVA